MGSFYINGIYLNPLNYISGLSMTCSVSNTYTAKYSFSNLLFIYFVTAAGLYLINKEETKRIYWACKV